MRHRDGGLRCAVAHFVEHDGVRSLLPACIECGICGQWIRPEHLNEDCPAALLTEAAKEA